MFKYTSSVQNIRYTGNVEPEINNETAEQEAEEKGSLHTVTPLSKYLAIILFIVFLFIVCVVAYIIIGAPEKGADDTERETAVKEETSQEETSQISVGEIVLEEFHSPSEVKAVIPNLTGNASYLYVVSDTDTVKRIVIGNQSCSYKQGTGWQVSGDRRYVYYLEPLTNGLELRAFDVVSGREKDIASFELPPEYMCRVEFPDVITGEEMLQLVYEVPVGTSTNEKSDDFFLSDYFDQSNYVVVKTQNFGTKDHTLYAVDDTGNVVNYCEHVAEDGNYLCSLVTRDRRSPLTTMEILYPSKKVLYADDQGWAVSDIEVEDPVYISLFNTELTEKTAESEMQEGVAYLVHSGVPQTRLTTSRDGRYHALKTSYVTFESNEPIPVDGNVRMPQPAGGTTTIEIFDVLENKIIETYDIPTANVQVYSELTGRPLDGKEYPDATFILYLRDSAGNWDSGHTPIYLPHADLAEEGSSSLVTDAVATPIVRNKEIHKNYYEKHKLLYTGQLVREPSESKKRTVSYLLGWTGDRTVYKYQEKLGVYEILIPDVTKLQGFEDIVKSGLTALGIYGWSDDGRYIGFYLAPYEGIWFSPVYYLDTKDLERGFVKVPGNFHSQGLFSFDGTKILGVNDIERRTYAGDDYDVITENQDDLLMFDLNTQKVETIYEVENPEMTFIEPGFYGDNTINVSWTGTTTIEVSLTDLERFEDFAQNPSKEKSDNFESSLTKVIIEL